MRSGRPRILVYARPAMGDVLLTTPLVRSLRLGRPEATLDVLVQRGQESILRGNPDIDEVIAIPPHPSGIELLRLVRRLARRYDIGIAPSSSDRAHIYLLLAAKRRYAMTRNLQLHQTWKRWLMTGTVEIEPRNHAIVDGLRLGELAGIQRSYEIVPPGNNTATQHNLPFKPPTGAYAVLQLTPGTPFKQWTLEGWEKVAWHLHERGMTVLLTGGSGTEEKEYLAAARRTMPPDVVDIAGRTDFAQLADILRDSAVYVGVDTVTTHLAAAVGARIVALYGPSDPARWGPWPLGYRGESPHEAKPTAGAIIVLRGGSCTRCGRGSCRNEKARLPNCSVMLSIAPDRVTDAIDTITQSPPPAAVKPGKLYDPITREVAAPATQTATAPLVG